MDSPPSTAGNFAPINANGPLEFKSQPSKDQSSFSLQDNAYEDVTQYGPSRLPYTLLPPRLKRRVSNDEPLEVNKRQMLLQPTPSSSPFQSFNITKPGSKSGILWPKGTRSITQSGGLSSSHMLQQQTTMDSLSRLPDNSLQGTIFGHSASKALHGDLKDVPEPVLNHPMHYEDESLSLDPPQFNFFDRHRRSEQDRCHRIPLNSLHEPNQLFLPKSTNDEDEYVIDKDEEEDMSRLLEQITSGVENHLPPSSVQDVWDRDSRSIDEYDSTLQFSTPITSSELDSPASRRSTSKGGYHRTSNCHEDLLDEDVDWNAVYRIARSMPKDLSLLDSREESQSKDRRYMSTWSREASSPAAVIDHECRLHPFVRPPFPETVRDRSPVVGLSSSTVLRTCFRIGEAINQSVRCHSYRQDFVLELFARVTYSSREKLSRRQHFQFADLFKDQQPYPCGILSNWRIGSSLDRQSLAFLETKSTKLCRTVCKPRKDFKSGIGWSFEILAIEQVNWEQILAAKRVVFKGAEERNNATTSNL